MLDRHALNIKSQDTLGEKLRTARLATGLSTRAVADRLRPFVSVSHATLANYERGMTRPPIDVMSALATLYQRPLAWFLGNGPTLQGIRYRNLKSKVSARDRHMFEGECQRWLDAYVAIEGYLAEKQDAALPFSVDADDSPATAAHKLRQLLGCGEEERLPSVVEVLEKLGCRVMETETNLAIDGLAARFGTEHVVMLSNSVTYDRSRMNAAHELGHILLGDCEHGEDDKAAEVAAFEFASHLLLTPKMLEAAFRRKSVVDLVRFKERFGISLAAMVYRASKANLISELETKRLWIEFAKRGWRTKEPGQVWPDRATRFEAIVDRALVTGKHTLDELAAVAGVRGDELKRRLAFAMGADDFETSAEDHPGSTHNLRIVR